MNEQKGGGEAPNLKRKMELSKTKRPQNSKEREVLVDCHMHTWTYPDHLVKEVIRKLVPPKRRDMPEDWFKKVWDAPIERYLAEAEGVVDKAILQGIRFPKNGFDVPNVFLAQTAREHPDKLAWCCCINPTDEGAVEELERCVKELGAVGVGEQN